MKRRRFVKALAAAPAIPAALAQQSAAPNNAPAPNSPAPPPLDALTPPAPMNRTPTAAAAPARLTTAVADEVADMNPRFFNPVQFALLRKLSDVLMPRTESTPGALDAKAPEFLDFLLSESPNDRQQIYRTGLDQLNAQAKKKFSKAFADLETAQLVVLLAPLKQAWTYDPPTEPVAHFLRVAKQDVRTATLNSREYASAASSSGARRGAGSGLYWYPID